MLFHAGCTDKFASDRETGKKEEPAKLDPSRNQFAENRAPADLKEVPFDGKRALQYIRDLCDIGPRISGSDGMKKQQEFAATAL